MPRSGPRSRLRPPGAHPRRQGVRFLPDVPYRETRVLELYGGTG